MHSFLSFLFLLFKLTVLEDEDKVDADCVRASFIVEYDVCWSQNIIDDSTLYDFYYKTHQHKCKTKPSKYRLIIQSK